jgi:predicted transcriptional regulator
MDVCKSMISKVIINLMCRLGHETLSHLIENAYLESEDFDEFKEMLENIK